MDKLVNMANEKHNFLSAEEEIRRLVELGKKGQADEIARIELAIEKRQLETVKKMIDKGYPLHDIFEFTGFSVSRLSNRDVIIFKTNMPESEMSKFPIFPNQHEFYKQFKKKGYQIEIFLIIKN